MMSTKNNNSKDDDNIKGNAIKDFFDNSTILVTGGTGFLGKVLIEKILRTCRNVRCVYILLRPKKGLSSDQRLTELIRNPIFDGIRAKEPQQLRKLVCVSGNVAEPMIGLSETDMHRLLETVNIVFHSAATVRFDEQLKDAINLNTLGSQRLFSLCTKMTQLKSIVHVSTAYCNPNRRVVEEVVYPPKLHIDVETFIKCVNVLPGEVVANIAISLQGSHPNTYTLTKSMGEQIAADYHHHLPICIVRPSIVTAAIAEPFPGWVDNFNGATGIMVEIGRGTISSVMGDKSLKMDIIPVDIVCNLMITAAWHNYFKPSTSIRVYNCTSGSLNPVIHEDYGRMILKYAREIPSKYMMLYPNFSYRTNRVVHRFYVLFLHFLPALLYDVYLKYIGMKPISYIIAKRSKAAADSVEFFTMHEWDFETTNLKELIQDVRQAKDGNEFHVDVSTVNWDEYVKQYTLGIRKYILKDNLDSLPNARRTVKRLYIGKWILQLLWLVILFAIAVNHF